MDDGPQLDRRGVLLYSKIDGRWVLELWVACRTFARMVKRPYNSILKMMRQKRIPAIEVTTGPKGRYLCLCPLERAKTAYKAMQKAGRTWVQKPSRKGL